MILRQIIIFSVVVLAGCTETTDAPGPASPYDLWRSQNIHSYTMEQVRSCFCVDGGTRMKVTVKADTVFSVIRLTDSSIVPYPSSAQYLSIDSLYAVIRHPSSDSLVVEYHSSMGYPTSVDINPQFHAVDGGVLFEISNVQALR